MIRLQIDEYENLISETQKLHKEALEQIYSYVKQVDELVVPDGGFHADMISDKVKLLLQRFEGQLVPQLAMTFTDTERQILLLGNRMTELDESGRLKVQWKK